MRTGKSMLLISNTVLLSGLAQTKSVSIVLMEESGQCIAAGLKRANGIPFSTITGMYASHFLYF